MSFVNEGGSGEQKWEDERMGRWEDGKSRYSSLDAGLIHCKKQDTRNKVSGIVIARGSLFYRHREHMTPILTGVIKKRNLLLAHETGQVS